MKKSIMFFMLGMVLVSCGSNQSYKSTTSANTFITSPPIESMEKEITNIKKKTTYYATTKANTLSDEEIKDLIDPTLFNVTDDDIKKIQEDEGIQDMLKDWQRILNE